MGERRAGLAKLNLNDQYSAKLICCIPARLTNGISIARALANGVFWLTMYFCLPTNAINSWAAPNLTIIPR